MRERGRRGSSILNFADIDGYELEKNIKFVASGLYFVRSTDHRYFDEDDKPISLIGYALTILGVNKNTPVDAQTTLWDMNTECPADLWLLAHAQENPQLIPDPWVWMCHIQSYEDRGMCWGECLQHVYRIYQAAEESGNHEKAR